MILKNLLLLTFAMAFVNRSFTQNHGKQLFDKDWKFILGAAQGAEQKDFNDASWRKIDLPHDWGIEDHAGTKSPFDPKAISQVSGGFTTGGTGWYRKSFYIPVTAKGKKLFIQFDGVYMNSDVWINGRHLGNHPYGYTSFRYDLSQFIVYGSNNTIAVEVKNEGQNSRWYTGSGIYRHVWLQTNELVHIDDWSTQITTPNVAASSAGVHFTSVVSNEAELTVTVKSILHLLNKSGAEIAKDETGYTIKPHERQIIDKDMVIKEPAIWSVETPDLYKAVHQVFLNEKLIDEEETNFGIRSISFSVANGFQLNGKTLKLKGGCFHHDNGPLGTRAYDRAEERKVGLLKKSGFNALRCSHNPPSPAFLDACDKLGMLVIDEAFDMWNDGKNPYDYHLYFKQWGVKDIESMVIRDRNHPSVIMWSVGNEIPESYSSAGVKTALMLADTIRRFDQPRAITSAVNGLSEDKDPYFATLDIAGYNYAVGSDNKGKKIYETDHVRVPQRVMVGTESYPLYAFDNWMDVIDHSYVTGDFVWTAFDYIGEASIGWLGYPQSASFYPWNLAFCGDIDICGWKRPQSYYRDALWMEDQLSIFAEPPSPSFPANPQLFSWSTWNWFDVLPDWNWKGFEKKPLNVNVYSSCDEVALFLNGNLLGKKPTNRSTAFKAVWQVPFQPGTLKAIGYKDGKQVNIAQLQTAGNAARLKLTADRNDIEANGQDLSYITVEICDQNGIVNPKSNPLIKFNVEGEGSIAAVGNANPRSIESYMQKERKAWQGKCLVIVKAGEKPGNIKLTATVNGLPMQQINITSKQVRNTIVKY